MAKSLSVTTCNGVIRTLKIILNDAVHDEIIPKSPADGIKALKETGKAAETYHRALTEQGRPIKHFTAHALRDTFATRYIEQGGMMLNNADDIGIFEG